jgi:enterochelin esterase-like enzyme
LAKKYNFEHTGTAIFMENPNMPNTKILPLLAGLIALSHAVFSQQLINRKSYCGALQDTVKYRVWLPSGYSETKQYPVFLTMEDSEDGLLAGGISLYSNAGLTPDAIVIAVENGRSLIGFDFRSGYPDEKGLAFLTFLMETIMPDVENTYHTGQFKVFVGHSLSATYANFLFLHRPGLFSAYILFAPERWWVDETRPPFELDSAATRYYDTHPCLYFLASGTLDEARRQAYAKDIAEKVSQLDTNRFFFRFVSQPGSDHISIVGDALTGALAHIFRPYYLFNVLDSVADPLAFFDKTRQQLQDIYGEPLDKTNNNMVTFSHLAVASKDKKAMDSIVAYFITDQTRGLVLANVASGYLSMGDVEKAKEYIERCIAKTEKDEMATKQGPSNLVMAYRSLSYRVYAGDNAMAWGVLERAMNDTHVKDKSVFDYYFGKLSADRGYRPKDGLQHLLRYARSPMDRYASVWGILPGTVYLTIAKCYVLMNDKASARLYAGKALTENGNDKEAKALLERL